MPPLRSLGTNLTTRQAPYLVRVLGAWVEEAANALAQQSKPLQKDVSDAFNAFRTSVSLVQSSQPAVKTEALANVDLISTYLESGVQKPMLSGDSDESDGDSDDDENHRWDCNQIRNKINRLLRSGEIKVTHWQKELGINSNSFGRFMKLKGVSSGSDNQTYYAAHKYFLKREKAGLKQAKPKKATTAALDKFNVDGIVLDGEPDGEVSVYDTCDDVRRKIQAHLRKPGVTQAGFCRDIAKTYHNHTEPNKKIQSVQLNNFLVKKGATSGNMSAVYYGAYVFFEKLRIMTGAAKSDKRLELEGIHQNGMDRKTNFGRTSFLCSTGRTIVMDDFGLVYSVPEP